jgi:hypothetical protein
MGFLKNVLKVFLLGLPLVLMVVWYRQTSVLNDKMQFFERAYKAAVRQTNVLIAANKRLAKLRNGSLMADKLIADLHQDLQRVGLTTAELGMDDSELEAARRASYLCAAIGLYDALKSYISDPTEPFGPPGVTDTTVKAIRAALAKGGWNLQSIPTTEEELQKLIAAGHNREDASWLKEPASRPLSSDPSRVSMVSDPQTYWSAGRSSYIPVGRSAQKVQSRFKIGNALQRPLQPREQYLRGCRDKDLLHMAPDNVVVLRRK